MQRQDASQKLRASSPTIAMARAFEKAWKKILARDIVQMPSSTKAARRRKIRIVKLQSETPNRIDGAQGRGLKLYFPRQLIVQSIQFTFSFWLQYVFHLVTTSLPTDIIGIAHAKRAFSFI
jgi:hypothetical protein